jgi:hypothetical protein
MTLDFALALLVCLSTAAAGSLRDWWRCRTPLGRVNWELERARERRRR